MTKPGLGRKFTAMICASALVLAGAVDFAQACTRFIYANGISGFTDAFASAAPWYWAEEIRWRPDLGVVHPVDARAIW